MVKRIKYLEQVIAIDDYLTLYEMFNDESYMDKAETLDDQLTDDIRNEIIEFANGKKYLILTNLFDREEGEVFYNTIFRVTNHQVAALEIMVLVQQLGLLNEIEVGKNGIRFIFEDGNSFMLFDYSKGVVEC